MVVEAREADLRGRLYRLAAGDVQCRILFTFHAIGRMTTWGLTERQVLRTLVEPEEDGVPAPRSEIFPGRRDP